MPLPRHHQPVLTRARNTTNSTANTNTTENPEQDGTKARIATARTAIAEAPRPGLRPRIVTRSTRPTSQHAVGGVSKKPATKRAKQEQSEDMQVETPQTITQTQTQYQPQIQLQQQQQIPQQVLPQTLDDEMVEELPHDDIDDGDFEDPIFCSEYVSDIFPYLKEKEINDRIDPFYMRRQENINERMRGILVNWLAEVHVKFRLTTETFLISTQIVDRYLEKVPIQREKLQLVGIVATFIASKFEEIYAVEISDLIYVSDNAFTREEILSLELEILTAIKFQLSFPTSIYFLRRWSKAAQNNADLHTLCKYLCEESALFYTMLNFLPSTVAAAAVLLGRLIHHREPLWTDTMRYYIGMEFADVIPCCRELARCIRQQREKLLTRNGHPLVAIKKKYDANRLSRVSQLDIPADRTFDDLEAQIRKH